MKLIPPLPLPPLGPPSLGLWNSEILWRYPPAIPNSELSDIKNQMPPQLSADPRMWHRDDVACFLRWCEREFDLPKFEMDLFQMNGKALCLLKKADLAGRIPGSGDLLHNVIQILVRESQMHRHLPSSPVTPTSRYPLSPHSHPQTPNWSALVPPDSPFHTAHLQHFMASNSVTLSPAPSIDSQASSPPRQPDNQIVQMSFPKTETTSSSSNQSDSDEDNYAEAAAKMQQQASQNSPPLTPISKIPPQSLPQQISNVVNSWNYQSDKSSPATPLTPNFMSVKREFFPDSPEPNTNGRLLWDFLQQLLNDPAQRYSNHIAWKCRDTGVFKIVDPAGLAKLWGIQKNHLSMNYDKMSRALRYYYRVNILRKVQGERHCYQFLRNPSELKNIKNISLLRQQTQQQPQQQQQQQQQQQPSSPSAISSTTNQQQYNIKRESQQQPQQQQLQYNYNQQPPPNSPMNLLTNSIHHHHINVPSPAIVSNQQFLFPPPPQYQTQTHKQPQQQQQQQPQHQTINSFKEEPKSDHEDMPTDLSIGNDRRYINPGAYPLIRNSNGLTTITLVQQQQLQQQMHDHLENNLLQQQQQQQQHQQFQIDTSSLNNESVKDEINIEDEFMTPTDLSK